MSSVRRFNPRSLAFQRANTFLCSASSSVAISRSVSGGAFAGGACRFVDGASVAAAPPEARSLDADDDEEEEEENDDGASGSVSLPPRKSVPGG